MTLILNAACLLVICNLIYCSPVQANSGLPMIFVVWPASWILIFLVIPLEAFIAKRILKVGFKEGFKLSCIANLLSTIAGIPVTWLCLEMIRIKLGDHTSASTGINSESILASALHSTYLFPTPENAWIWRIPLAALFLCIPFFLMSVWVEYLAAQYLHDKVGKKTVLKWAWIANSCSYGLIMLGLLVLFVISFENYDFT